MPKEMERFGTVKVISGEFKGRIGYYDDDDYIFPDGIVFDDNDKNEDIIDNAIPAAIVYFGYFSLAAEHHAIPYDDLEYVSMNDLVKRKDELTDYVHHSILIVKSHTKNGVAIFLNYIMLKRR